MNPLLQAPLGLPHAWKAGAEGPPSSTPPRGERTRKGGNGKQTACKALGSALGWAQGHTSHTVTHPTKTGLRFAQQIIYF